MGCGMRGWRDVGCGMWDVGCGMLDGGWWMVDGGWWTVDGDDDERGGEERGGG